MHMARIPPSLDTKYLQLYNCSFAIKAKKKIKNYILISLVMRHCSDNAL